MKFHILYLSDLSPLDYSWWSWCKAKLYEHKLIYETKSDFCYALQNFLFGEYSAGMVDRSIEAAVSAFPKRVDYCLQAGGSHFEHLLKKTPRT